ncbi:MAG: hypothetical protein SNF33_07350 [Candidatus Algichlamydia australiensis]|nr:hypothetical protein [Chlamydiales bacterium]
MTFLIAALLLLACVFLLSIGKWLTGKNHFHLRRCGRPEDKECPTCGKKKRCNKDTQ